MPGKSEWVRGQRAEAWAFGRRLYGDLLRQYQNEYGSEFPPPPARIIDELLADFLDVDLRFDPLPLNCFAKTARHGGRTIITVNSRTAEMAGVKDAVGVQNVAKFHEGIHGVRDLDLLDVSGQACLPGFESRREIACYRAPQRQTGSDVLQREFFAEEAGRAAAVSLPALLRTDPFRSLASAPGMRRDGWPRLYEAATEIGVNISALVAQLTLEGWIVLAREGGKDVVYVQPALSERRDAG